MKCACSIAVALFLQTFIHFGECDRQVTFTCDRNSEPGSKGEPGPPGKRGPIGNPGPVGPVGNAADLTDLEQRVRELNRTLRKLSRSYLPSIYHFQLPASQITWVVCKRHCENLGLVLCSKREIFPRKGLMRSIGTQLGDHWAPIRDTVNDWVEFGTTQGRAEPGDTHIALYGAPPWGIRGLEKTWKGHFFCCSQ